MPNKFLTKEEIRNVAKGAIGKTFEEISDVSFNYNNKGTLGQLIEKSLYKFANNSKPAPDFEEAGIELKLTPYKKNSNGTLSAKERLVLNIINYMDEYKYDFEHSHFMFKNRNIQLIWYLYEDNKLKKDFHITNELFFSLDDKAFINDLKIIRNDWQTIIDKIIAGKAHEISESDTMYLGACPKGANKTSLREQPFSTTLAMQRAFCYKTSYMTLLVRKYIANEKIERVIKEPLKTLTFEEYLVNKIKKYIGKDEVELAKELKVKSKAKNKFQIIFSKMLEINDNIENSEEFIKANIKLKTIRVEENGGIKESMSFPAFKFEELVNESWNDSNLYKTFATTKFLFVIFKKVNGKYVFDKIKLWNMPSYILNKELKLVWSKTKSVVSTGNIVNHMENGIKYTNFPKITDNKYCHVRPHGKNSSDVYPLPIKDKLTGEKFYTKHCFWLNREYVKTIIEDK